MKEPEQPALFEDVGLRTKFAGIMGELEVAFQRRTSTTRVEVYWRYLHALDIKQLHRAAVLFIEDVGKFPSIADWKKLVKKLEAAKAQRERGRFERVPGIYCEVCEDTGRRFWEGTVENKGQVITVDQWRHRGPGWVYRAGVCPCRDHNPNYQCDLDEKSNTPPDIDRDKAKQMMAKYVGRSAGRW